jgi:hypothetical protein
MARGEEPVDFERLPRARDSEPAAALAYRLAVEHPAGNVREINEVVLKRGR